MIVASHGVSSLDNVTAADWMRTRLPEALLYSTAITTTAAVPVAPHRPAEEVEAAPQADDAAELGQENMREAIEQQVVEDLQAVLEAQQERDEEEDALVSAEARVAEVEQLADMLHEQHADSVSEDAGSTVSSEEPEEDITPPAAEPAATHETAIASVSAEALAADVDRAAQTPHEQHDDSVSQAAGSAVSGKELAVDITSLAAEPAAAHETAPTAAAPVEPYPEAIALSADLAVSDAAAPAPNTALQELRSSQPARDSPVSTEASGAAAAEAAAAPAVEQPHDDAEAPAAEQDKKDGEADGKEAEAMKPAMQPVDESLASEDASIAQIELPAGHASAAGERPDSGDSVSSTPEAPPGVKRAASEKDQLEMAALRTDVRFTT